ncbi:DUF2889 domain-containing protein [Novosphingobium album (ex Liu et al. 2023)]|uniref:DUF2889 domain-containing protein n=1 Tax=Novosphingobium album (ex Liu et al. 2023) TaxID=3031130 RepID=A0ABT5WUC7_9SPHN|nr:DUF2889 domain-containing protein [Novosphingobium album (ex Liu et al. 2023)]MDE8653471.1 DUF2889 domain-containing protein [Novosphingobium album (ex Liu et al. 2023)]
MPDPRDATTLPGYRRVLRVEPGEGSVLAMLEDDIHCMAVRIDHADGIVTRVDPVTDRMPWTMCPGAGAVLVATFAGLPLAEVTARRSKKQNCTHLHDLAVLAAAHAHDRAPIEFAVFASDPVAGRRLLEIRRDGAVLHHWVEQDGVLVSPPDVAGQSLLTLRDWIGGLAGDRQEAARLLRWASLVAHGRTIPEAEQSEAAALPPNCYTFQPERAAQARRVGERFDFSAGSRVPLAGLHDRIDAARSRNSADANQTWEKTDENE